MEMFAVCIMLITNCGLPSHRIIQIHQNQNEDKNKPKCIRTSSESEDFA